MSPGFPQALHHRDCYCLIRLPKHPADVKLTSYHVRCHDDYAGPRGAPHLNPASASQAVIALGVSGAPLPTRANAYQ